MIYECGPVNDRRTLDLSIPHTNSTIGIFISGGLDSALLYYLLQKNNLEHRLNNVLVPIVVIKKGTDIHQVKRILAFLKANEPSVYHVSGPDDGSILMRSVIKQIYQSQFFTRVYLGVLEELPEFLDGWEPHGFKSNKWLTGPLSHLNKTHTVDLVYQLGLNELFTITHSCARQDTGRCNMCNRCRERSWAFGKLGLTDPGIL